MKNKTTKIFAVSLSFFLGLIFISCQDDILDKVPKDNFSDMAVWSDEALIEMFVNDIYSGVNGAVIGIEDESNIWEALRYTGDAGTGELLDTQGDLQFVSWMRGDFSPSERDARADRWIEKYKSIRKCNLFLEKMLNVEDGVILEGKKNTLVSEIRFLRAYFYHDLVATFGAVPIVDKAFDINDDLDLERSSYETCVDFIVADLDAAIEFLPEKLESNELGRITKAAAYAQKSRTLLYANSSRHNPSNLNAPRGVLYDYTKNTLNDASNACKAIFNSSDFTLVKVSDFKEYQRLFIEQNNEQIWVKVHNKDYHPHLGLHIDLAFSSPGFEGWGMLAPTHNFVQSFQMANGKHIDEIDSDYDSSPENIYKNKEMRFYSNVLYHGCEFRGRQMLMHLPDGVDFKENTQPWNGSTTRYYQRKILDETIELGTEAHQNIWPKFRLAEIYLNYAEINYYMGNEAITHEYINKVRERVMLPSLDPTLSGENLFNAIVYERRMELHNENHRFFDVRRWLIADITENENMTGIEWYRVKPSFNPATDDMTNENNWANMLEDGKYVYREFVVLERKHPKRQLYLPIHKSEIQKNPKLIQNEGYENM